MVRIPKRYQENAWQAFVDWCLTKGLNAVPAHHWTLSAYALTLETEEKPDEIRKIILAVAKAHLEKSRARPDRHPLVERTLKIIAMRQENRKQSSKLFDDDLTKTKNPKTAVKAKSQSNKKALKNPAKDKKLLSMSSAPKLVSRRRMAK